MPKEKPVQTRDNEVRLVLTDEIAEKLKTIPVDEITTAQVQRFEIQRKIEHLEAEIDLLVGELASIETVITRAESARESIE